MKKYIIFLLSVCFCACQYPKSDIETVEVHINAESNKESKQIVLTASLLGVNEADVQEKGFCYAGFGGYDESNYPHIGLNKHAITNNRFSWTFGEDMSSKISSARAYVIVNDIVIYSSETVDVNIMLVNL